MENTVLNRAKVIAGRSGLDRIVSSINTYDGPMLNDEEYGAVSNSNGASLTLSGLYQFESDNSKILDFVKQIDRFSGAGLVITDNNASLIGQDVCDYCNSNGLPLLSIPWTISYAEFNESIGSVLYLDKLHEIRENRIKKIEYETLSDEELEATLYCLNANMKSQIVVLLIDIPDSAADEITFNNINLFIGIKNNNFSAIYEERLFFILSDTDEKNLASSISSLKQSILSSYENARIGVSSVKNQLDLRSAIKEAKVALRHAELQESPSSTFISGSLYQFLIHESQHTDLKKYYNDLKQHLIPDSSEEEQETQIETISMLVQCNGNYAKAAELLFINENTLRYRIRKLREEFTTTDNSMEFNAALVIFAYLHQIYKKA